jgi:hypothetical protein
LSACLSLHFSPRPSPSLSPSRERETRGIIRWNHCCSGDWTREISLLRQTSNPLNREDLLMKTALSLSPVLPCQRWPAARDLRVFTCV